MSGAPVELPPGTPCAAVIGATGFVGRWFLPALRRLHPGCVGTSHRGGAGLVTLDLARPETFGLDLAGHSWALLLGARTGIKEVEEDPAGTRRVNVDGPLKLARGLLARGIRPVVFSSDYVFDGVAGRYTEDSPTGPGTEYGRQKLELERRLLELAPEALVIRLGKTFSTQRGDGTLLDEMAGKLRRGEVVRAATDQVLGPVRVEDAIRTVAALLADGARGVFHVSGNEPWVRHDLATALAAAMGADPGLVEPIRLAELASCPPRPLNTAMLSERLRREGIEHAFTPVAESIAAVAATWGAESRATRR